MARTISLEVDFQETATQSYEYSFTATGSGGIVSPIFVLRQAPLNPTAPTGTLVSSFDHISSPTELTTLPVNAPIAGSSTYRVSSFSLTYQSQSQAAADTASLESDINALIDALNLSDAPSSQTIVLTGTGS